MRSSDQLKIQHSKLNIAVGLVFNVKLLGCETIHNRTTLHRVR